MNLVGLVAIGRNEGQRLRQCLQSAIGIATVIYVDSGSTDGSVELARSLGVEVVELDLSVPFTAARARNAGFRRLQELDPTLPYVQFVDGDCEIVPDWLDSAIETLEANPDVVAVCGRRQERYKARTPYNRICDVEWGMGSPGETLNFGGDVIIRTATLAAVGGYNESVIAAEDDELSVRLRQRGGKILRLDRVSTLHDADMHHFFQWWRRAKRCGYGYAQVSSIHGKPPERKFVKEVRRNLTWGVFIPVSALALSLPTHGVSLLLFLRYPLTAARVIYGTRRRGFDWRDSIAWGLSCGGSVFPEALGMTKFISDRFGNKQHEIIEYKGLGAMKMMNDE